MRYLATMGLCFLALSLSAQQHKTLLPNGWTLTPAGRSVPLGDLPLNIAISKDQKFVAVTNNGVGKQTIQLIDAKTFKVIHSSEISKSWLGLKFSDDGKFLYASGGNNNRIVKYKVSPEGLSLAGEIVLGKKWPAKISPAGLDIDSRAHKLYVVTKGDKSLYVADVNTNKVVNNIRLSAEAYTCVLSPDHNRLYISLWGGEKLLVYDTHKNEIVDSITVGRNPNDICVSDNGKYLFVANSIDNSVSVIDAVSRKVLETLNAALYPGAPNGSTTNSVTLSKDNKTLFIANADNNCVGVFDVSTPGSSHSKGFIPVGWYPTCVRVLGNTLLVTNGKGNTSLPNPRGPQPAKKNGESNYKKATEGNDQYIGSLLKGALSVIQVPDQKQLAAWSKQVYSNTPYSKEKELQAKGEPGNPIPMRVGGVSPIQHVFYIIKENRTYDQVLADMPGGNGDTSLLLFGRNVTPNEHALAEQYVLLDNFYVDAEVSADGHNWSTAAYANDFVEKNWPTNYGGRGNAFDYISNKKVGLPRNGFLWDYAIRKGLSFRDYGEFTDDDNIFHKEMEKYTCGAYPGWDLKVTDREREKIWEKDFDSLVANGAVPGLSVIYLPGDHTAGLSKKYRTPNAYVADNDMAVGKLVEHLSESAVWKSSAVFILEDDAQNGPDHVDAHRSTAFLAGPFVRKRYVDHSMYSTSAMLRTIELILGLPPMSQYDAGATPMYKCFTTNADNIAYKCKPAGVDLEEMNVASNHSTESEQFDFSRPDNVPDLELNRLLWGNLKGYAACPAPRRAAFVSQRQGKNEDDE